MSVSVDPKYRLSLQGKDYVQVDGLVDAAHQVGLRGMNSKVIQVASPENGLRAVVEVTVLFEDGHLWTDIGDADPSTTRLKAYERLAATRALGRVLRRKLNVADLAYEELPQDENGTARREDLVDTAPAGGAAHSDRPRRAPTPGNGAGVRDAGGAPVGQSSAEPYPVCGACGKAMTKNQALISQNKAKLNACPACLKAMLAGK